MITIPSAYSISSSDKVTLAGGWTLKGFGSVVSGIVATSCCVPKV